MQGWEFEDPGTYKIVGKVTGQYYELQVKQQLYY